MSSYLDWSEQGRSTLVRYAIGLLLILVSWFVLGAAFSIPFTVLSNTVLAGSAAGKTLGVVAGFCPAFVTVPLVTRFLLKRPWWSFGFPKWRIDYRAIGVALLISLFVSLVLTLFFGAMGLFQVELRRPDIRQYLLLLVTSGIGLFVQTSTEEFMFRGYLTQFVRRYLSNPIGVIGIPALIFAAMHIANIPSFGEKWYALLPYLAQALLYGWFAYRTGALWTAIGLHWANNLSNVILVGTDIDVIPSLAPVIINKPSLAVVTGVTIVSSLLTFVLLEGIVRMREGRVAVGRES